MTTTAENVVLFSDEAIENRAEAMAEHRLNLLHRLVEMRIEAGLTQAEVAEMLGVTPQAVSKYERYDWDPRLSTLERYANAIGAVVEMTAAPHKWSAAERDERVVSFAFPTPSSNAMQFVAVAEDSASAWHRAQKESRRMDFQLAC